jgi:hypothetical protein
MALCREKAFGVYVHQRFFRFYPPAFPPCCKPTQTSGIRELNFRPEEKFRIKECCCFSGAISGFRYSPSQWFRQAQPPAWAQTGRSIRGAGSVHCLRSGNEISKLLIASLENRLRFSRALSNPGFGKPPGGKCKPCTGSSGDEPERKRTRTREKM